MPCDEEGRDWSTAVASQGMPRIARSHQELQRGKKGLCHWFQREHASADTLTSGLQGSETSISFCLKPHYFWFFVMVALGNDQRVKWPGFEIFCCVLVSNLLKRLRPPFPHLWFDGNHKTNILALLQGIKELIQRLNTCKIYAGV